MTEHCAVVAADAAAAAAVVVVAAVAVVVVMMMGHYVFVVVAVTSIALFSGLALILLSLPALSLLTLLSPCPTHAHQQYLHGHTRWQFRYTN